MVSPVLDALYCDEARFDDDVCSTAEDSNQIHDLFWEDEEILTLLSKEISQAHSIRDDSMNNNPDGFLKSTRNGAVKWMLTVVVRFGFSAVTAVLAVNYYDRFIKVFRFQRDKPWMSQLAAVACLSVAAKVEETHVPLLLDFQVEECKYMFESKTIQRMELLVLSTLQWKMNPVTPISFVDHIVRRFELITNLHSDFADKCQSVLLSIITDCRYVHYLPSVIAAAVMKYVINEMELCDDDPLAYLDQITSALRTTQKELGDCYELITEVMRTDDRGRRFCHKRKHDSIPGSPSGVIDAYFSSDSSNDSWAVGSSTPSSPSSVHLSKRSKAQDRHMRLGPLSTVSWHG